MKPIMLATLLPIGTVVGIAALFLAFDRWGAKDKLGAARELRGGTSPLHRERKASEKHEDALRLFHARQPWRRAS